MDRDWRWMTIKESHTKRIAAIRDPWFDASRMRTDESTIGTVAATGEADIKDPLKEHRAAAYLGSNEILLQQSDIIDVAKSADRT